MAETQVPSIGYAGEVWLHNGTGLTELKNVISFTPPGISRGRVDATHLKSAGQQMANINGMLEVVTVGVKLQYRPLSDTDVLVRAAALAGNERDAKFVIPMSGAAAVNVTPGKVVVTKFTPGEVTVVGLMECDVEFEIVGTSSQAAAA